MLKRLRVCNFAIVESVEIEFGASLNIITGETGAGKSVLMGALGLVLGGRAEKSAVRDGAKQSSVEAEFELSGSAQSSAEAILDELDIPRLDDGALLVRRTVNVSGAGKCFVNDVSVSATTLRRLGEVLLDIHGPYDHQSLLSNDYQCHFLDAYGSCRKLLDEYRACRDELRSAEKKIESLCGDPATVAAEIEMLSYAVDELERAALSEADGEALIERHHEAANAERIVEDGNALCNLLSDGEGAVFELMTKVQRHLSDLSSVLRDAEAWRNDALGITLQVQELYSAIRGRISSADGAEEDLQALDERVTLVERLKRKYGPTLEDVLKNFAAKKSRLDELESRSSRLEELKTSVGALEKKVLECGEKLSAARAKAAVRLAREITGELRDLGFARSEFGVGMKRIEPGPLGLDAVDFSFAPNNGETARPLKAIASSGEIARVALAAKTVLSAHDSIPVLVFDEIDSNIGGEVGSAIGLKLARVAAGHQVICITHLPQTAVFGTTHFSVSKSEDAGRTRTAVRRLGEKERIDEIARMLGGRGMTSVVEKHAAEMLASAFSAKEKFLKGSKL